MFAKPEFDWSILTRTFGENPDSFQYFYYIMKKGEELSVNDKQLCAKYCNKEEQEDSQSVTLNDSFDEDYLRRIEEINYT